MGTRNKTNRIQKEVARRLTRNDTENRDLHRNANNIILNLKCQK